MYPMFIAHYASDCTFVILIDLLGLFKICQIAKFKMLYAVSGVLRGQQSVYFVKLAICQQDLL